MYTLDESVLSSVQLIQALLYFNFFNEIKIQVDISNGNNFLSDKL